MKPILQENYTDNGAHSHWSVIDADNGETLIRDINECVNEQANSAELAGHPIREDSTNIIVRDGRAFPAT
jgi:hypothetical protein